jgi:hypothetical protein
VCAKALVHDEAAFKVLLWLTRGEGMIERLSEECDLSLYKQALGSENIFKF